MTPERFQQIDRLVSVALECNEAERAAFVSEACKGDRELLAEVESLLASHKHAGSFLAEAPKTVAFDLITSEQTLPAAGETETQPESAPVLGRFVVVRELGRGGMGVVYAAHDPELGRQVAIKVMRPGDREGMSASESRARIVREAQAMAKLAHPNVISVYDVGTVDDRVFIVMEHVEGTTLTEWLAKQKRPWREIVNMFVQTGRGLAAAHAAGILHRDFKPDNVLVGKDGRARVVDFGLARALSGEPEKRAPDDECPRADANSPVSLAQLGAALTKPGRLMGTPAYMAPEQLMSQRADERTDQFSFCVSLYQGLYHELPFKGDSVEALLQEVKSGKGKDAPTFSEVPAWLRRIVLRGLSFNPEERYASMGALLDKLSRGAVSPRRHAAVLGSIFVAALLALAWLVRDKWGPASGRLQSIVVLPFENLTGDPSEESLVDGFTDALTTTVAQLSTASVIGRDSAARYKNVTKSLQEIGKELSADAILRGSLKRSGSRVQIRTELIKAATGQRLSAKIHEGEMRELPVLQADVAAELLAEVESQPMTPERQQRLAKLRSIRPEVYEACLKGRLFLNRRNESDVRRGIEYFQQAISEDPNYAPAYVGVADGYKFLSIPNAILPPKEASRLATEALTKALSLDPDLGEAHASLADVKLEFDWDWRGAERESRRAIELNPNEARVHRQYFNYLMRMRRSKEALVEAKRAQHLDPLSPYPQQAIALWYAGNQQYDRAIQGMRKAIELEPNHGPMHYWLGATLHDAGMYHEALAELRKAFGLSGNPWHRAETAHMLVHLGRVSEAEQIIDEIKERVKDTAAAWGVVLTYATLRRKEETLQWLEYAYQAHANFMLKMNQDEDLVWLRSDPHFQDLVRRVGWPQ